MKNEFQWELNAMRGEEMPEGLSTPDQMLYLALRMLYNQYKTGIVSRETASREKKKLLRNWELNLIWDKAGKLWNEQIRLTEEARSAYRKERTLENADKLLKRIEGAGK